MPLTVESAYNGTDRKGKTPPRKPSQCVTVNGMKSWWMASAVQGTTKSRQITLSREQQKTNSLTTGLGDSKPIKVLCSIFAEIRKPTSRASTVCRSNETTQTVFPKFVILHVHSDADEAIHIQNLLQNKFCVKSGKIFAAIPFTFLNGSWHEFQSFTSLANVLNIINYNSVIPLRPLNSPFSQEKTFVLLLQAANAL
ncbi:PREDICTED: LOW QUALITY PROTEIN: TIR domain-containing adapter molecule 2 [Apaloderma vittatum]|uniref:LOW QUALITY PROTEIN: TIR domain-containing adapter molecule 2 n=1 Tax=Apaloderma vittatum TaxID=57397 RepID=UPI000521741D|nr:PREDICTED: LOW QUALITY PROTEIN: TIR domain-containing adapter molecule 2 [Apaloderma vittatum]